MNENFSSAGPVLRCAGPSQPGGSSALPGFFFATAAVMGTDAAMIEALRGMNIRVIVAGKEA